MIVISRDFVLSEITDDDPDAPLIGYRNIVTAGNVSASSAATGFPASNLGNDSQALKWRGASAANTTVTVATGFVDPIDYVGIADHNFGSAGIPIVLERREDALGSYATVMDVVLPDDAPVILRFAPQSFESLRLTLLAGSAAPEAAVLYVGSLLAVERKLYQGHTPISLGRKSEVVNGKSESGNFLGRIQLSETAESSAAFRLLSPAWYRANFDPFVRAARDVPFFFAWRPASYPRETGFCWLTNDPKPVNADQHGLIEVELQMNGLIAP